MQALLTFNVENVFKMDRIKIVVLILTVLSFTLKTTTASTLKFQAAHNSNATLTCNYKHFKMPVTPWQIYWILPNETVIQPYPKAPDDPKYRAGYPPTHNLTITNINHRDFGWYYCLILWDNYHYIVDSVKVGLNVDGALYDDLYEEYKVKVITGSVAAAGVLIILSVSCAIWHYRCSKEKPVSKHANDADLRAEYEFDKTIKKFDQVVDDNETDPEIIKDEDEETDVKSADDGDSVNEKLKNELDEVCRYAFALSNRAYLPDGQEDLQIDTIVLNENRHHILNGATTGATAF